MTEAIIYCMLREIVYWFYFNDSKYIQGNRCLIGVIMTNRFFRILCAIILLFLQVYFQSCETFHLHETPVDINDNGKIKIIQITDIHFSKQNSKLEKMMTMINDENPDVIFFTGDFVDRKADFAGIISFLANIKIDCPKYAVQGNYESGLCKNTENLKILFKEAGIELLVNQVAQIKIRNINIQVFGMDDYLFGKPDFSPFVPSKENLNIVLAHCPIMFDFLNKQFAQQNILMLSGHTHGGQITFFGIPLYLPLGSSRYISGLYTDNGNTLYVSKGVGYSTIKLRLFADSAIELLEIR